MKRVLITGVTGNLGRACQRHFRGDWETLGISRNVTMTDEHSGGTYAGGFDLRHWSEVERFCLAWPIPYDLVIMTHGVQETYEIGQYNQENWQYIVGGNLESCAALTNGLHNHKLLKEGSMIVYCSSIQASQPRSGRGLYAIAKAGLEALARITAVELAPRVRTVALRLGQMDGTMQGIEFDAKARAAIEDRTPLPWVSFSETAALCHALHGQSSMTGETIEVSSGHRFNVWP
jgi:NAD(P)-dependent dehydrogenase (short-subunit alcohol dehydrogenase family)